MTSASSRCPTSRRCRCGERGPRSLHEIPGTEIAEVMLAIRVEHDLIGRDELFRAVLAAYKLRRLTQASEIRLNDVLTTWLA